MIPLNEFSEQFTGDFKTNPEKKIFNSVGLEVNEGVRIEHRTQELKKEQDELRLTTLSVTV